MEPLKAASCLPLSSVINSTSEPYPKHLLSLIELLPDHTILWNLHQLPQNLREETFERDLFVAIRHSLSRKGSQRKFSTETYKNLDINICEIIESWKNKTPTYQELDRQIFLLEEYVVRYDFEPKKAALREVNKIKSLSVGDINNIQIEIKNDQQAYLIYLLLALCSTTFHHFIARKMLLAITNYKNLSDPKFEDNLFVKKLSLLLLLRSNPTLAMDVIDNELKKSPKNQEAFQILKDYATQNLHKREEALKILKQPYEIEKIEPAFQEYLNSKPLYQEAKELLQSLSKFLIEEKQGKLALDLIDKAYQIYMYQNWVIQLKKEIFSQFTDWSDPTLQLTMRGDQLTIEENSNPSSLQPLVIFNPKKDLFKWNFNQDPFLLDIDCWAMQLRETLRDCLLKSYSEYKNDVQLPKILRIHFKTCLISDASNIGIKKTPFFKILPSEEGMLSVIDFMNHLFLQGRFHEICETANFFLREEHRKKFGESQLMMIAYTYLVAALEVNEGVYLKDLLLIFGKEFISFLQSPFLEKIRCLIAYRTYGSKLKNYLPKLEASIAKNSENFLCLSFLKVSVLAHKEQYAEARALLKNLGPLANEKVHFYKILCQVHYLEGNWKEAKQAGEKYFDKISHDELELKDWKVAWTLSVIYRYELSSNPKLQERLIKTLNNPKLKPFPTEIWHMIFSIIVNTNLSIESIPLLENEDSKIKAMKEAIRCFISHETLKNATLSDQLIKERPEYRLNTEVYYIEALEHYKDGKYIEALKTLNHLDAITFNHLDSYALRAQILFEQHDYKEACKYIQRCFRSTCHSVNWYLFHIRCLIKMKDLEAALKVAEKALDKFPDDLKVYSHKLDVLNLLNLTEEYLEIAVKLLDKPVQRETRLKICENLYSCLHQQNNELIHSNLSKLQDGKEDPVEIGAFFLQCKIYLENKQVQEVKRELVRYNKNDCTSLFIHASIDVFEGHFSKALETLSICRERLQTSPSEMFAGEEIHIKDLEFAALIGLKRFDEVCKTTFKNIPRHTPIFYILPALRKYIEACEHCKEVGLGIKACETLLRTHPHSDELKEMHTSLLEKTTVIEIHRIPEIPNVSGENVEKNGIENITVNPEPIVPKKREHQPKNHDNAPLHPAVLKKIEAEKKKAEEEKKRAEEEIELGKKKEEENLRLMRKKAKQKVEEMFSENTLQEEIGFTSREMYEREIKEIERIEAVKLAEKSTSTTVTIIAAIPANHMRRFTYARNSLLEIAKILEFQNNEEAQVDPIYKDSEFVSRLMLSHLFSFAELLKIPKKIESPERYVERIQKIFLREDVMRKLRNLIALYGQGVIFEDLVKFCNYLLNGKVLGNLECLTKNQPTIHAPLQPDLQRLFPLDFNKQMEDLEMKKKTLLGVISSEIKFVIDLNNRFNCNYMTEDKGKDYVEVIKGSVLRIGKSLSGLRYHGKKNPTGPRIYDPILIGIIDASKLVRHQKLNKNLTGEQLQVRWLKQFVMNISELPIRIRASFS